MPLINEQNNMENGEEAMVLGNSSGSGAQPIYDASDYKQNRDLIGVLLDESDSCEICQNLSVPLDCVRILLKHPNIEDQLGGWLEPGIIKTSVKKKKTRRRSADDALYLPFNDYESHQQRSQLKSADDSWINVQVKKPLPFWKSVVETDTYRYIPNNGRYRVEKTTNKILPIKPKRQERSYLTTEQRALQKEIQRDLRREFESQKEQQNNKKSEETKPVENNNPKNNPIKLRFSHGESVKQSDGALEQELRARERDRSTTHLQGLAQRYTPTLDLPPISGQGNRSFLDPFMEQVSKKLLALDAEMQRDSSIKMSSRKSNDEPYRGPKPDSRGERKSGRFKSETVNQDTFSVKKIIKDSEHRLMGRGDGTLRSYQIEQTQYGAHEKGSIPIPAHVRYTTSNGDIISIPIFSNIHAPNTASLINQERQYFRNSAHTNVAPNESLENTLQTVKCKVRDEQSNSNTRNKRKLANLQLDGQTRTVNNGFPGMQVGQTRDKSNKQDFHTEDSYPDLLPKVSGKRLEVPITTHR